LVWRTAVCHRRRVVQSSGRAVDGKIAIGRRCHPRETQRVATGERPFGITIDTAGKRAYTADVGSNSVTVIDILNGAVIGSIPTGERPYAVGLAQGKGFATDQYGDTVTAFDLKTLMVVETIDVGEYPEGIMPSFNGETLIVANWFSNSISILNAKTLEVVGEIDVGDGPRAFGNFLTKD